MVVELNRQSVEGFILKHISVSCPECECSFATPTLLDLPPVTEYDTVEADLHRVLPEPELRGALIAVCPHCNYSTWTVRFKLSSLSAEMLPDSPQLQHSKKFALAVKYAREKGVSPLDVAFIALNGLYSARESGEEPELWLELAAYEQSRGITEESLVPANGQDHLIMAELWRQLGSFDRSIEQYEKAAADEFIPKELIEQQIALARVGNNQPTMLAPYIVRDIFPDAGDLAQLVVVAKNGRAVPPNIIRQPKPEKLGMGDFGPPDRRPALSSAVKDQPKQKAKANTGTFKIELDPPQIMEPPPAAEPVVETVAPAAAVAPAPAKQNVVDSVPVNRMRGAIAQPAGGSAIYLVQAAQVPQIDTTSGKNGKGKKKQAKHVQQDTLPPMEAPTNEYFAGASSPSQSGAPVSQSPTARAVSKALRDKKEQNPDDQFPEIQLTDEEPDDQDQMFGYEYEAEDDIMQQPAAAQQGSEGSGASDFSDAIAQVESFLSLTRQSSYQSWIRGYKR